MMKINMAGLSAEDLQRLLQRTERQLRRKAREQAAVLRQIRSHALPERVPVSTGMIAWAMGSYCWRGCESGEYPDLPDRPHLGGSALASLIFRTHWRDKKKIIRFSTGLACRLSAGTQKTLTWDQLHAFAAAVGVPYQEFILFS